MLKTRRQGRVTDPIQVMDVFIFQEGEEVRVDKALNLETLIDQRMKRTKTVWSGKKEVGEFLPSIGSCASVGVRCSQRPRAIG